MLSRQTCRRIDASDSLDVVNPNQQKGSQKNLKDG